MPDRAITHVEYSATVAWVAKMNGKGVTTDTIDGGRGYVVQGEPLILVSETKNVDGQSLVRVGRLIASSFMIHKMVRAGVITPTLEVKGK